MQFLVLTLQLLVLLMTQMYPGYGLIPCYWHIWAVLISFNYQHYRIELGGHLGGIRS